MNDTLLPLKLNKAWKDFVNRYLLKKEVSHSKYHFLLQLCFLNIHFQEEKDQFLCSFEANSETYRLTIEVAVEKKGEPCYLLVFFNDRFSYGVDEIEPIWLESQFEKFDLYSYATELQQDACF